MIFSQFFWSTCSIKTWITLGFFKYLFLAVRGLSCSRWDLVPWPVIELQPPAPSLSHWTTKEVPFSYFKKRFLILERNLRCLICFHILASCDFMVRKYWILRYIKSQANTSLLKTWEINILKLLDFIVMIIILSCLCWWQKHRQTADDVPSYPQPVFCFANFPSSFKSHSLVPWAGLPQNRRHIWSLAL